MKDIREVAGVIVKTANYYQIPIDEVIKWVKDEIIDIKNNQCFHYELKNKIEIIKSNEGISSGNNNF